ncbi:type VI secretion system baseplate subunit TssK [Fangia hongkongensis]|uniref:type VI secretion system baseplate subunit TssK n=1 Tax=Fangia hongkongensis TaxID=270495 RepID=UPI0003825BC1|nr:type VI secretion system baseplate subunit TssK [Fangia hongkongensis]MBK2124418.1 hypothetical protein [Fangia hongkongensis]
MSQVHWQMGQLLSAEHFTLQQDLILQSNVSLLSRLFTIEEGVYDVALDESQLNLGVIELTALTLILVNQSYLLLKCNVTVGKFTLPDTCDNKIDIYLNIAEEDEIKSIKKGAEEITVKSYRGELADAFDEGAAHSIKLFELAYSEKSETWQINPEQRPKLTALPYIYAKQDLERIASCIDQLYGAINALINQFNTVIKYQTLLLELARVKMWLSQQHLLKKPICFDVIFNHLYTLIGVASLYQSKRPLELESMPVERGYKILLTKLEAILNGFNVIERTIEPMNYVSGVYQSNILTQGFFEAVKKYIVIEGVNSAVLESHIQMSKVFCPTQTEEVLIKSTAGVRVTKLDNIEAKTLFPDASYVLAIDDSGDKWKAVIDSKLLCIKFLDKFDSNAKVYLVHE